MKPTLEERETIINFGRLDKVASVYTSDDTVMTKLDKFVKQNTGWKFKSQETCQGDLVSKTYECPVEFISFRSKKMEGRKMTEEQKQKATEIFRQYRESQKSKIN